MLQQAALSVSAYSRIKAWLSSTPCIPSRQILTDKTELYYKADNFQKTGSFKFRGALSKLTSMSTDVPAITASSGNHGLGLSTAAKLTGHNLTVVLPETVAREKLEKIKALGVETILHSNDSGIAEQHAQKLAKEQGKIYVSPYNDPQIIAGQGTLAIELLDQLPDEKIIAFLEDLWGDGFLSPGGADEVRRVLDGVAVYNKSVIDIGCGSGACAILLAQECGASSIVAIDVESPVCKAANKRVIANGLSDKVSIQLVEPGPLPFADEMFDLVFSKDSIIHIPDKEALALEAYRVLKPGGCFAASDWLISHDNSPSSEMVEYLKAEGLDFAMASPARYEKAMKNAGFSVGVAPAIIYAAHICGADKILAMGGVQGIAAMTFGLFGLPKANILVGPGNQFVAEAKRLLFGRVGIDMIAGPTDSPPDITPGGEWFTDAMSSRPSLSKPIIGCRIELRYRLYC